MPWVKFIKEYGEMFPHGYEILFEEGSLHMMADEETAQKWVDSGYAIYVNFKIVEKI
jgi:hypothetical protein